MISACGHGLSRSRSVLTSTDDKQRIPVRRLLTRWLVTRKNARSRRLSRRWPRPLSSATSDMTPRQGCGYVELTIGEGTPDQSRHCSVGSLWLADTETVEQMPAAHENEPDSLPYGRRTWLNTIRTGTK